MLTACIANGIYYDFNYILPHIQYVKNTTVNRTIKCSPYYALFAQDVAIEQNIENIFSQIATAADDDDGENIDFDVENRTQFVDSQRKIVFENINREAYQNNMSTTRPPPKQDTD